MAEPGQPADGPAPSGEGSDALEAFGRELRVRVAGSGQLSPNDEQILSFLHDHLDELAFHTSESIAQGTGVSRAAVVRFARRLGYTGFAELRGRGRDALRTGDDAHPDAVRPARSLLERKALRDAHNVALLAELLEQSMPLAGERVADADRVWCLAGRETHGLALYFHHLLHHVRDGVHLVDPGFPDALRECSAGDVLVVCTFRPYARQTVELLGQARRAGARAVIVTDAREQPFLTDGDLVLAVPVDSPTMFLSFTPAMSVLEALAAYVARADVDRTHRTLAATDRFVAAQRLTLRNGVAMGEGAVHADGG